MRRLVGGMEAARHCPERGPLAWRVCASPRAASPVYQLAQVARTLSARAQCGQEWSEAARGLTLRGAPPAQLVDCAAHLHRLAGLERAYRVRFALAPVLAAVRGGEEACAEAVERAHMWSLIFVRLEREGLERESPATR